LIILLQDIEENKTNTL